MKNKLEVGQTVYLHKKIGPQPTKVIKVGKKYFQVDAARIQFFIDTLQSNSQYGSPNISVSRNSWMKSKRKNLGANFSAKVPTYLPD